MKESLTINIDGASRGNPGPAAIGVVIQSKGKCVKEISQTIGETTNNVAEYTALIYALQEAVKRQAKFVEVLTDSQLVCAQVKGQYKVKTPHILPLISQVRHLIEGVEKFSIRHIPREENKEADRLANLAFLSFENQNVEPKVIAPLFDHKGEESPSSKG